MRTANAERVLTAARLMLIRHGDQHPVDPRALEWARFIAKANPLPSPGLGRDASGRFMRVSTTPPGIVGAALARRHALELAWMP